MFGQMWVQFQVPAELSHPSPVVMIHGRGQTGVVFQGTPDGRPGWSDAFVAAGFAVYVVDLPGRGRAQGHDSAPPDRRRSSTAVGNRVAHIADPKWPQAIRHTQWPASDADGPDVFEQFYASQVPSATEATRSEALARAAGCALLQRIGPSVLLSHSQGGPVAWGIADSRPELVSGIVAIEPNGPPVHDLRLVGAPDWFEDVGVGRAWGLSRTPLTFDPPPRTRPSCVSSVRRRRTAPAWPRAGCRPSRHARCLICTGSRSWSSPAKPRTTLPTTTRRPAFCAKRSRARLRATGRPRDARQRAHDDARAQQPRNCVLPPALDRGPRMRQGPRARISLTRPPLDRTLGYVNKDDSTYIRTRWDVPRRRSGLGVIVTEVDQIARRRTRAAAPPARAPNLPETANATSETEP